MELNLHSGGHVTFKSNWEKSDSQHQLKSAVVEKMVQLAYPDNKLISQQVIGGGCANLNVKIQLEHSNNPLILRIYLRDKTSAEREQKLGLLLKQNLLVPATHFIGDYKDYHFAITEFMPGITLRDLLLSNTPHDMAAIMFEVGKVLSEITQHTFPMAGFFDKDLNVIDPITNDDFNTFAIDCLKDKIVISQIDANTISKISYNLNKYSNLFPDENDKHLVHADFDPANILVDNVEGEWKITGILDWEFAFSGSVLCDVANMLRYAHHMPAEYEEAFLGGLKSSGIALPANWRISVHMLNMLSLLDCLKRSDPKNRPNQCADICALINHILKDLKAIQ